MRIAIVGAGAIGGVCAGLIRKEGYDVELICSNDTQADQINANGLTIQGIRGQFTIELPAKGSIEQMTPAPDVVLLAVKATTMLDAAQRLLPLITPSTQVVSLQNGICEHALGRVLGPERVIGCVTGWGSTFLAPDTFEMTSTGEFMVGYLDRPADNTLQAVQQMLSCVVPVTISEDIIGDLYSKLIINSCITSLGAVCGLYLGQMLAEKQARLVFFAVMKEAMEVAKAMDIHVPAYAGKLDYKTFFIPQGWFADLKRHLFLRVMGFKYRRLKSSSLQSLERGRKTEIDYLTGFVTSNAQENGIRVPVNQQIYDMVREIEAGKRSISAANIQQIRVE